MSKSLAQLQQMLEYMGVRYDRDVDDRHKLAFLVSKQRKLNALTKGMASDGEKKATLAKLGKEEARLMLRTIEELRDLLAYMDVEVDHAIVDKEVYVSQIISQRHMHEVSQKDTIKHGIQKWRKRAVTQEEPPRASAEAELGPISE